MEAMEANFPERAKQLTDSLSRPILLFDSFKFIPFIGKVTENSIQYQEVIDTNNLVDKSIIIELKKGNKLVLENKDSTITIYKDSKKISKIDKIAEIFDFH
jgi:hypothetical protein